MLIILATDSLKTVVTSCLLMAFRYSLANICCADSCSRMELISMSVIFPSMLAAMSPALAMKSDIGLSISDVPTFRRMSVNSVIPFLSVLSDLQVAYSLRPSTLMGLTGWLSRLTPLSERKYSR